MRQRAGYYDKIHLRDPVALAELDRNVRLTYSAPYQEKARAEKDIADGKYAEQAKSTREEIAKAEAQLVQLMSGPLKQFDRPFVRSWHQRRDLVRRPGPGQKLVDIIEVAVP